MFRLEKVRLGNYLKNNCYRFAYSKKCIVKFHGAAPLNSSAMIEWPNLTHRTYFEVVFQVSPKSNRGKLVENGGVDSLVVFCVFGGEVAKSPLAKNHRKILLVGDLLKLSSDQFSGKLENFALDSFQRRFSPGR